MVDKHRKNVQLQTQHNCFNYKPILITALQSKNYEIYSFNHKLRPSLFQCIVEVPCKQRLLRWTLLSPFLHRKQHVNHPQVVKAERLSSQSTAR